MANTQERRERMLRLLGLRERWKVGELAREFGVWLTEHSAHPTLTVEETAALRRALAVLEAGAAGKGMPAPESLSPQDLQTVREIIRHYGKN